jgi:hypothetical protein
MPVTPFCITFFLQDTIAFTIFLMLSAILAPVVRIILPPFYLSILLIFQVIRISGYFLALPATLSRSLTGLSLTIFMIPGVGIQIQKSSAIFTAFFPVHALPPWEDHKP